MMADPHIGFIVAAFAIAGATLVAMIGAVVFDYRRLSRQLRSATEALDSARGANRG
jgi:heme exporter protein CcmD